MCDLFLILWNACVSKDGIDMMDKYGFLDDQCCIAYVENRCDSREESGHFSEVEELNYAAAINTRNKVLLMAFINRYSDNTLSWLIKTILDIIWCVICCSGDTIFRLECVL